MRPGAGVLTGVRAPGGGAPWSPAGLGTFVLVTLLMVAVAAPSGCTNRPSTSPPPRSATGQPGGRDFRDVAVLDQRGQEVTLRAAVAGRPALISFWAPWCAPCVKEQPELERLARAVEVCGGVVIAVAVGETPEVVTTFARERHLSFEQLADEHFRLADALGQRRIPTMVVLDRGARVVFTGEVLDTRASDALESAIASLPGAARCALR
jgi:thiol-disulfide isomerase/thioredoxin